MERIDIQPGAYFPLSPQSGTKKAKGSKKDSVRKGMFQGLFESEPEATTAASGPLPQQQAEELFQSIQAAGEKLKHFPGRENVEAYTSLVRDLVERVVRDGIVLEEHSSGSHILKRKNYSLLTVVNSKLAQLADGMLATQRDQMILLEKVDEIQGILVNLLH